MLCAKYGFAQSMECPAQSSDQYFAQQSMDLLRIPWIDFAQSMDQAWRGFVLFWSHVLNFEVRPGKVDLQFIVKAFSNACGWEVIFHFSLLALDLFM